MSLVAHAACNLIASGHRCANGTTCSSTFTRTGSNLNDNPNDGVTGFDNIGAAWVIMFQSLSHEGWADVMNKLMAARGQAAGLFFVVTIILTSYFAANLALGVIYEAYKKQHQEKLRNEDVSKIMKRHAKRFFTRITRAARHVSGISTATRPQKRPACSGLLRSWRAKLH